eukprot:361313-Chlamydomonas_euryale.AAC.12
MEVPGCNYVMWATGKSPISHHCSGWFGAVRLFSFQRSIRKRPIVRPDDGTALKFGMPRNAQAAAHG